MSDDPTSRMELYRLYLATAEKVSDRRAAANTWMLSVNSAIVGFYGYLAAGKTPLGEPGRGIWLLAIPAAGILVCLAWAALLASYSKLNGAKFKVLQEIEEGLPFPVFRREQEVYRAAGRRSLSSVERLVPWCFAGLYGVLLVAAAAIAAR